MVAEDAELHMAQGNDAQIEADRVMMLYEVASQHCDVIARALSHDHRHMRLPHVLAAQLGCQRFQVGLHGRQRGALFLPGAVFIWFKKCFQSHACHLLRIDRPRPDLYR